MTDYMADDDDEDNDADELTPSQNIGETGFDVDDNEEEPSEAEEEPVEEEEDAVYVEEYDPKPLKSFKHDKRKLYQIKDELANLEQNNQKFLSVLLGMKTSLQLKNSEEEDVSGYVLLVVCIGIKKCCDTIKEWILVSELHKPYQTTFFQYN